ncbi:hypothetical protein URS_2203 [Acinetobacter ursingii]|nr:hypothetical protein URS_2203 [Acinetobacter ursingii]
MGGKYPRFLNGVCRHELSKPSSLCPFIFLNGVCRHEHNLIPLINDL